MPSPPSGLPGQLCLPGAEGLAPARCRARLEGSHTLPHGLLGAGGVSLGQPSAQGRARLAALERRRGAWANALVSFKTEGRGGWGPAGLYLSLCQSSQRWSAHGTKCQAREVGPGPRSPPEPLRGVQLTSPQDRGGGCEPEAPALPPRSAPAGQPGCSEKAASDGEGAQARGWTCGCHRGGPGKLGHLWAASLQPPLTGHHGSARPAFWASLAPRLRPPYRPGHGGQDPAGRLCQEEGEAACLRRRWAGLLCKWGLGRCHQGMRCPL